jgi:hypothetical protein
VRDEEWWTRRQDRLAKLQARSEDTRPAAADTAETAEAASLVRGPRRGRFTAVLFLVGCLVGAFVLGEVALTLSRFTGNDIDDAKRLGRATVLSCERHGPVGVGFGYWDRCTADVVWDNGVRERVRPRKQGFFASNEIGHTVTIGDLGWYKGSRSLARKELPSRPLVTLVGAILGFVALLPVLLLLGAVWFALRNMVRRLSHATREATRRS